MHGRLQTENIFKSLWTLAAAHLPPCPGPASSCCPSSRTPRRRPTCRRPGSCAPPGRCPRARVADTCCRTRLLILYLNIYTDLVRRDLNTHLASWTQSRPPGLATRWRWSSCVLTAAWCCRRQMKLAEWERDLRS